MVDDEVASKLQQLKAISAMSIDDPLSISNSDNPNAQLTQLLFDESNFVTWSRQLCRALGAKMKIGFLTGAVAKPSSDSKDLPRWTRCDEMVVCWMLNSMVPELSNSFILTDSTKDLWLEIVDRYSQVLTRLLELEDQDRLLHFLVNLNSDYDHVKSQIIAMEPVPTLNRAYYLVLQVEKQKQLTHVVPDPTVFQAGSVQTGGGHSGKREDEKPRNKEKKHCSVCQLDGHNSDGCFEVIGYPDWYKGKRKGKGAKLANAVQEADVASTPLGGEDSGGSKKFGNIDPTFVQAMCAEMMKDLLSRNLVAEGRARGGLYTLLASQKDVASCFNASKKPEEISRASVEPVVDGIASVEGEDTLGSSEVVDNGIVPIRQSTRTRHAPAWTDDYVLQVTDNVRHS
ncbi:hypothetical protein V2J09_021917 [Rumex salicifolius]